MAVKTLKANFAINVLGALVPLAVALVTVPIYIKHIGAARYGVLSIVWVLLGYFGFLDLGLSRAAANALAKLRDAPQAERARVLVTTMVLNLGLGLVGSLCLALAGSYLLQHVLAVPDALKPEIAQAFPWIVGLFPLALISGVGIGALESREKFLLANVLQVSGMSLGQIVPVVLAVVVSPSLAVVIPAAAIARGLTVIAIFVVVYREEGPLRVSAFDRGKAGQLFRYGGWVTVTGAVSPLLGVLDQFVIGSVVGVAAVANYSVPMNLVTRTQILPSALARTLFPRMSRLDAEGARALASRAFATLSYGYGAICAPAIVLTPAFFKLWIGGSFAAAATPIALILFLGAWINGLAFVPYELLQSQGKPDIPGKFHVVEIIPFAIVLLISTYYYGVSGAAMAWTIRCAADAFCLLWAVGMPRNALAHIALPLSVMMASEIVAITFNPSFPLAITLAVIEFAVVIITMIICVKEINLIVASRSQTFKRFLLARQHN